MTLLNEILEHNETFVQNKEYEPFVTTKYPNKHIVIISCMDTRLVELLPKAMNFRNGDVKIIKSAGAVVSNPFGGIMRSILVAVYALQADEVYVVGHYDCGMSSVDSDVLLSNMKERGVSEDKIKMMDYIGVDLKDWLHGFGDIPTSVKRSVDVIRNHPLMIDIPVHGLIIDPNTGHLDVVFNGHEEK